METERILLRYWQESDAEVLFKYASDPDVGPRAGWPAHKSVEDSREIIRTFFHNETTWAIVLKETGEDIGCIGYYTHETSNIHDIGAGTTHGTEVGLIPTAKVLACDRRLCHLQGVAVAERSAAEDVVTIFLV